MSNATVILVPREQAVEPLLQMMLRNGMIGRNTETIRVGIDNSLELLFRVPLEPEQLNNCNRFLEGFEAGFNSKQEQALLESQVAEDELSAINYFDKWPIV